MSVTWSPRFIGMLALSFAMAASMDLKAAETMNIQPLQTSQIKILPGSSSEASALLAKTPNAESGDLWPRMQPFSVLLVNCTEKTIIGYAAQWDFTMPDGTKRSHSYHYGQPDALLDDGKTKIDAARRLHSKMIGPFSSQLVYPLAQIALPLQLTRPLSASAESELEDFEQLARLSTQVAFTLDAVLFEDGTVLGTDKTQFTAAYEASFAGEQQIVKYIVASAKSGVSPEDVATEVEAQKAQASKRIADGQASNSQRVFSVALVAFANEFLSVQGKAGYDAAVAVAKEHLYESSPKLTLHRDPAE
jgi:hypothetical protein